MKEEIHKALVEIGFTKNGRYYTRSGQRIRIYENDTIAEVFKRLIIFGEIKKVWEFKSVMQIIN